MIENTNPDCGVLGSCQTIHAQESPGFAKLVLFSDFILILLYIKQFLYSFSPLTQKSPKFGSQDSPLLGG